MSDSDPAQSYPDRNFASIDNLRDQIQIYKNYYTLYPGSKAKIDELIAKFEEAIKVLQELPTSKGGKRRSKRAHSKRRVHCKSHRKSHRRH